MAFLPSSCSSCVTFPPSHCVLSWCAFFFLYALCLPSAPYFFSSLSSPPLCSPALSTPLGSSAVAPGTLVTPNMVLKSCEQPSFFVPCQTLVIDSFCFSSCYPNWPSLWKPETHAICFISLLSCWLWFSFSKVPLKFFSSTPAKMTCPCNGVGRDAGISPLFFPL